MTKEEAAAKLERDKDQTCAGFDGEFGHGWTYHPGRVRDVVYRLAKMLDRSQEVARQEQANSEKRLKRISESEADAAALKRENRRLVNMLRHMCATAESNKTAWYMTGDIYSWFTRERHATPAATPAAMTPDEQRVRDAEIANLKRFAVLSFKPVEYESAAGGFKPTEQSKKDAVEFVRLRDAIKHSLATGNPAEPEPIRLTAANGPQWEELPAIEPESPTPAASPTAEEAANLEASRAAWDAFSKQFAGCASQYFQALESAVRQVREQLVEFVREHKKEMERLAAEVVKPRKPFRFPDRPEPAAVASFPVVLASEKGYVTLSRVAEDEYELTDADDKQLRDRVKTWLATGHVKVDDVRHDSAAGTFTQRVKMHKATSTADAVPDRSGQENHGTVKGVAAATADEVMAEADDLDGLNSRIRHYERAGFKTIGSWFRNLATNRLYQRMTSANLPRGERFWVHAGTVEALRKKAANWGPAGYSKLGDVFTNNDMTKYSQQMVRSQLPTPAAAITSPPGRSIIRQVGNDEYDLVDTSDSVFRDRINFWLTNGYVKVGDVQHDPMAGTFTQRVKRNELPR